MWWIEVVIKVSGSALSRSFFFVEIFVQIFLSVLQSQHIQHQVELMKERLNTSKLISTVSFDP